MQEMSLGQSCSAELLRLWPKLVSLEVMPQIEDTSKYLPAFPTQFDLPEAAHALLHAVHIAPTESRAYRDLSSHLASYGGSMAATRVAVLAHAAQVNPSDRSLRYERIESLMRDIEHRVRNRSRHDGRSDLVRALRMRALDECTDLTLRYDEAKYSPSVQGARGSLLFHVGQLREAEIAYGRATQLLIGPWVGRARSEWIWQGVLARGFDVSRALRETAFIDGVTRQRPWYEPKQRSLALSLLHGLDKTMLGLNERRKALRVQAAGVALDLWPHLEQRPARRIWPARLLSCALHRSSFYGPLVSELETASEEIRDEMMRALRRATRGRTTKETSRRHEAGAEAKTIAVLGSPATRDGEGDKEGEGEEGEASEEASEGASEAAAEAAEAAEWYSNEEGIVERRHEWMQRHLGCRAASDGVHPQSMRRTCTAVLRAMRWYFGRRNLTSHLGPYLGPPAPPHASPWWWDLSEPPRDPATAPLPGEHGTNRYFGKAALSILGPGMLVRAHTGPTNQRLVLSLGLEGSLESSEIRVAKSKRSWQKGRVIAFDDSFEHEVRVSNATGTAPRAVLIVHVPHPHLMPEGSNGRALADSMDALGDRYGSGGDREDDGQSPACEEGLHGMVDWVESMHGEVE
jgi:hypothetical protein